MENKILLCLAAGALAFFSCDLFTQPEPSTSHVTELINEAQRQVIEPTHDFIAKPESLTLYPPEGERYTFICTQSNSIGGLSTSHFNYKTTMKRLDSVSFCLAYSTRCEKFNYAAYNSFWSNRDSLTMRPDVDSVYYTAFRDTDGRHILLYQTEYMRGNTDRYCCQLLKEGLGLVYEQLSYDMTSMDGGSRCALLLKINDSTVDVVSLLSRIMGMKRKFAELIMTDSTAVMVSDNRFDSIQVFNRLPFELLFSIESDTVFAVSHDKNWDLVLWGSDTVQTIYIISLDSIAVFDDSYALTQKIPYEFLWW